MFGRGRDRGRGPKLPGEAAAPAFTPSIALRCIDGHLVRTGQEVYAWYRLAPQRWSFRSDSQRQDLIQAMAGQYADYRRPLHTFAQAFRLLSSIRGFYVSWPCCDPPSYEY